MLVWKCLLYLLWHWNLLTKYLYGIYRIHVLVPRKSALDIVAFILCWSTNIRENKIRFQFQNWMTRFQETHKWPLPFPPHRSINIGYAKFMFKMRWVGAWNKAVPVLNQDSCQENWQGSRGTAPWIDLVPVADEWSVSISGCFISRKKGSWYLLDRRLGRHQSLSREGKSSLAENRTPLPKCNSRYSSRHTDEFMKHQAEPSGSHGSELYTKREAVSPLHSL